MGRDRPDELAAFLAEAHRNGYAAAQPDAGPDGVEKRITYDRGDRHYRDVYAGSDAFVGHEIVALDGEPIWGMHYDGRITAAEGDSAATYDFLRRALAAVTPERPYRGPERFEDGPWVYESTVDGALDRFEGRSGLRGAGRPSIAERSSAAASSERNDGERTCECETRDANYTDRRHAEPDGRGDPIAMPRLANETFRSQ